MFEGLFQPTHLLIVLIIVLIIFGPGKLPDLGKALGQGIREFRESATNATSSSDVQPQQSAPSQPQLPVETQSVEAQPPAVPPNL